MRRYFHILILLFPLQVFAQQIQVSIFNSVPVKGLTISVYQGKFEVGSDSINLSTLCKGDIIYVSLYDKRLLLNNANGPIGYFDELFIKSKVDSGKLSIAVIDPKSGSRTYSGNFHLKIEYGRILLFNEIDNEKYIAGVVEAEAGINAAPEFYKAQALICRTYLYGHLNRHETEGFNLCDEVHCQAYKGITAFTPFIYKSTILTSFKIILNSENSIITASFHANCGGETESPVNAWLKDEDNLVPVKDPYCKLSRNANWEKKIALKEWKHYLNTTGVNTQNISNSSMEMRKPDRQTYYRFGKDSILTRQIRADWNLKSSFFQISIKNNYVIITGRGYGHGVGLCQDGAMNMATQGFNYQQIINFYFKNVHIEDVQ